MGPGDPTRAQNPGVGWHPSVGLLFLLRRSDLMSLCSHPCVCGWLYVHQPLYFLGRWGEACGSL